MNLYSATWIHILNMDLDPNNNRTLLLILYFFVIYALVDVDVDDINDAKIMKKVKCLKFPVEFFLENNLRIVHTKNKYL